MKENIISQEKNHPSNVFNNALEETLREGARKLLQQAIECEVDEYIKMFNRQRGDDHKKSIVRNGYLPQRALQTGIGPIGVRQARVRDKTGNSKFTSAILPKYIRKTRSIETVIPALYLKGISTSDFSEALEALLGSNAKGLSPSVICRLKETWKEEFKTWNSRELSGKQYVYIWADGIYFNVRLTDDRPCVLVLIGALPSGKKEVIAIQDGQRESALSWRELLLSLSRRGLEMAPSLAVGDGALGFWKALEEVYPSTKQQRCWVHKTANILDKMPKSVQKGAKMMIHEMYLSPTKQAGLRVFEDFISLYEAKYPRACECLKKDKKELFTFYDFPAMHWQHIRTTNPIESSFATVRHRTRQTKGCGSRESTLSLVFKLAMEAEKNWQKLRGSILIEKLIQRVKFVDGEEKQGQEIVA
jgi:transposase-like protein